MRRVVFSPVAAGTRPLPGTHGGARAGEPPVHPAAPSAPGPAAALGGLAVLRPLLRDARGQATVELVAVLPVLVAAVLAAYCVLAAGRASVLADGAAEAGAIALLQDRDAVAAARAALPGSIRRVARVRVTDRVVVVEVRPGVPLTGLAHRLTATGRADAGPEPAP